MSNDPISSLAAAGTLGGSELLEVSQLSSTVTITAATLSALASDNSFNDSGSGFVAAGFAVGMRVRVTGFTGNVANNLLVGKVTALTAGKMTIGGTDGDVIVDDAAGESVTISQWTTKRASVDDLAARFIAKSGGTMTGDLVVPDEAYDATAWNGSNEVPTKNAVRDKIEAIVAGGTYTDEQARDAVMAMLVGSGLLVETENDGSDSDTLAVNAAADTDIWAGSSTTKAVTPDALLDSAVPQTLTDGATVTPDFGAGFNFEWAIGGSRTLANPTNAKNGQSGTIKIVQDATGSRVITYGSNWRFPGGSATGGVLSTAANSIDLLAFTVGTDGKIYATLSKAFAA